MLTILRAVARTPYFIDLLHQHVQGGDRIIGVRAHPLLLHDRRDLPVAHGCQQDLPDRGTMQRIGVSDHGVHSGGHPAVHMGKIVHFAVFKHRKVRPHRIPLLQTEQLRERLLSELAVVQGHAGQGDDLLSKLVISGIPILFQVSVGNHGIDQS